MSDLLVSYGCDACADPVEFPEHTRPATPADVVAWLQANGGETQWWCRVEFPAGRCYQRNYLSREAENYDHSQCGLSLVYRLPDEEQP